MYPKTNLMVAVVAELPQERWRNAEWVEFGDSKRLGALPDPHQVSPALGYELTIEKRGITLLRDPHHNKGLAFTEKERDAHYLRGLLPPAIFTQSFREKYTGYCFTDGERILGLGDLGCQGMGIPVGKLSLYTALGGLRPSACLPVTIDVGTNNEQLLNDEFYIGLKQKRATGKEYAELLDEFMTAVKQNYGEKVLVQFEDFANHNAFELLTKYSPTHLVFNDDIQGTASVVLAGLLAALNLVGGTLADHKFLFLGAGEAGTGIAELIALEISKQIKGPIEETRKKIWLVDSKGLIVSSRKESLQHFKKPWAHEHEPVKGLLDAVKTIKPTVLIGSSGVGKTFTKEVVEAMASFNEGRAIFASGSPFDPVEYNGKVFVPGQFPLATAEALAAQVKQENFDKGLIYPPFSNIRKISAHIAAKVAAKAYELGLSSRLPRPKDLVQHAESCMYSPVYRCYR
ncbi:hypothetical protein GH714_031346 [Hevea brasiliensis]|uniref:Malic enzyme n=1 Tax=Hevea brasiliensis TaxID=3981 RepID=A0A6A6LW90_HEVBR|nr:hypothetical protein GH714_031346 [Hevea brasiliensis]